MTTLTCHGCKHCLYSAPFGQANATSPEQLAPHSCCDAMPFGKRTIPMQVDKYGHWLSSTVPAECPQFRQPRLAG